MTQQAQSRGAAEHDQHDEARGRNRATAEWLPADLERIRITRTVGRPAREVEESLRLRPGKLIQVAYGCVPDASAATVSLTPFESMRWLRIPVRVEFSSPGSEHPGTVISIRWQASRFTSWFPVMDADLEVRPRADVSDLVLEATYRAPLGLIGLVCDRLFARWVAGATAKTFLDRLGDAVESDDPAAAERASIATRAAEPPSPPTVSSPHRSVRRPSATARRR